MRDRAEALTLRLAASWSALLLCGSAATASTITGNIRNTIGNAYATNVLFTPLSTPQADGANIIASTPTNVIAAADGSFSVTLKQGNYKVNIGNVPNDTFIISVPNDSSSYNLTAIISSQLIYSYPSSPLYEEKINKAAPNGYASLNGAALVPLLQLGSGAANGYFLGTDGATTSWQPPPAPYLFDTAQFGIANNTNISVKKAASLTNLVLFSSGVGPALGLAAGAHLILTNGNITVKSNGIVTIGDNTGIAQLRFQAGAFASDYTGSEQWNFKTTAGGGRDNATVARIDDITNGLAIATQNGAGTNATLYATISTNVPLGIVGASSHATNHLEIRNNSGAILGYVATNGFYRSQYDFYAQVATTDATTANAYTFTPRDNSVVRIVVNYSAWHSSTVASYGRIAVFKTVSGTITQIGATSSALGTSEEDAAFDASIDFSGSTIRVRVAGNTGKTVNWVVSGSLLYAP